MKKWGMRVGSFHGAQPDLPVLAPRYLYNPAQAHLIREGPPARARLQVPPRPHGGDLEPPAAGARAKSRQSPRKAVPRSQRHRTSIMWHVFLCR